MARGKKKPEHDSKAPDGPGQVTLPNPGELPPDWEEKGTPRNSLGTVPARGNRAGGGAVMDNGAVVGYKRNLEFTAGARSAIVGTGTTSAARPHISPQTGEVQISATEDTDEAAGQIGGAPARAGSDPHRGNPPSQPDQPGGWNADIGRGPGENSPGPGSEARHGSGARNPNQT
jgi:hypothetical protein